MIKAGVIGWPIKHSKSPIIHRHWLLQHQIVGTYDKIAVPSNDLGASLDNLMAQGYAGINVTLPHKMAVLELADYASPAAMAIGAANTVLFKDGKIHADNTDAYGFLKNLMQHAPNWNASAAPALILGAGGAARAVVYGLLDAGAPEVIIANRTYARAQDLAQHFGVKVMAAQWCDIGDVLSVVGTLVNTTSLGMMGQPRLEIDLSHLQNSCLVNDIVYNPLETDLLRHAAQCGCPTVDGLGMLLHQAAPGFKAWFGVKPQVDKDLRDKVLVDL